ncbi:MAG: M48 family metallopeptidase [Methylococcales bacterium]
MTTTIELGEIVVDVVFKDIKNLHLSVYPPDGGVRISAPLRLSLDSVRVFAIAKLGWIRQQRKKMLEQARETPREFLDRESHYVWGKRYLLEVVEHDMAPAVQLKHSRMILRIRPGTDEMKKQTIVEAWYREQIKKALAPLIAKWKEPMGVKVARFFVQRMKTQWGSCNPAKRSIRVNTELAKKPRECLEYIVVHEMTHLLEPTHNARFISLLDRYTPQWQFHRDRLNRLPLSHEDWSY